MHHSNLFGVSVLHIFEVCTAQNTLCSNASKRGASLQCLLELKLARQFLALNFLQISQQKKRCFFQLEDPTPKVEAPRYNANCAS